MNEHPLYSHINEIVELEKEAFKDIIQYFKTIHRKKHQFIVQAGNDVNFEFFVIKGCLKSSVFDEGGKEHIIQFAMENWWITDYTAFLHQEKAKLNIDCLENCHLLSISYEKKEEISLKYPKMERFWSKKTKTGHAALQNRILSLIKDSAKERYESLTESYPELIQRVPKKYIASFLGVSRETLSRL